MSVETAQTRTNSASTAAHALAAGDTVVLTDDVGGARLIHAAEHATTSSVAFMIHHTSGFLIAAMPPSECERLDLPPMWWRSHGDHPSQCVSVDHCGPGTGISARDRARTLATLADPAAVPSDFIRPGHVVPVSVPTLDTSNPMVSPEHAALALLHVAGSRPVAVLGGLVDSGEPTQMSDGPTAAAFAARHGLVAVSLADVLGAGPDLGGCGRATRAPL